MAKLDRLGWAATSTFLIGHHYIGVRSSTDEADDLLRRILAPYLVTDVEAPPNYSFRVGGQDKVGREMSQVYRSATLIVRSRTPGQAMQGLLHDLCRHQHDDPDGLLRARTVVLLSEGQAFLVPHPLRELLVANSARCARRGFGIVDAPFARIDPVSGDVFVGPPPLDLTDEIKRLAPAGDQPAGYLPIGGWGFFGTEHDVLTEARAVALAASTLANPSDIGAQQALDLMERLIIRGAAFVVTSSEVGDLLSHLDRLRRGSGGA